MEEENNEQRSKIQKYMANLSPSLDHLLDALMRGVDESEGGDVGAAVFEVLEVHQVQVQVGDQVVVVGCHHTHSLGNAINTCRAPRDSNIYHVCIFLLTHAN